MSLQFDQNSFSKLYDADFSLYLIAVNFLETPINTV